MTLCLAWKQGNKVYLASDSRLTASQRSVTTDDATKIFRVNVEIHDAGDSDAPYGTPPEVLQRTTFGLAFAGSYLNGSLFADTIEEVLSNVQVAPGISDYSIDNLASVAFAVYKQLSRQLMEINRGAGLAEILFGGTCLISGIFQLYRFFPDTIDGLISFEKEQVQLSQQGIFLGDGAPKARELEAKVGGQYTYYHLLREVIQDAEAFTVGGNIQTGVFDANGFRTYGIMEYSAFTDDYGVPQVKDSFRFRNLLLDLDAVEFRPGNIHIRKEFVNPFEHERNEHFNEVFAKLRRGELPTTISDPD